MSYQALYRKYRSQTFSEMVGQENVSNTLKNEVKTGKISHAYLFSGPRGTGKTSAAKIFAKAVNCPHQIDGEPCNQCEVCQQITEGTFDDVLEIDAASNNGVDEIREIRDKVNYAPTQGKYKVYIIDEVHMLSTGAFNALLKTLEEPPENVVFILATTELYKVPATILSRVARFQFKSIRQTSIVEHIQSILDENSINYSNEAVKLIAKAALGGMRDALSILDQALSLDSKELTIENALIVSGLVSEQLKDQYVSHINQHEIEAALSTLSLLFDEGVQVNRFIDELLGYFRDLLLYQKASNLISHPSDLFIENSQIDTAQVLGYVSKINQAVESIRFASQPKLILEILTISLAEKHDDASKDILINTGVSDEFKQLKQTVASLQSDLLALQNGHQVSKKQAVSKPVVKTVQVSVSKDEIVKILNEAEKQKLVEIQRVWNEFLDHLTPIQRALLNSSRPVAASQHGVILEFTEEILAKKAMENQNLPLEFENLLSSLVGFSPRMVGIGHDNWLPIRDQFRAQFRANKQNNTQETSMQNEQELSEVEDKAQFVQEARQFFGDIVEVVDEVE